MTDLTDEEIMAVWKGRKEHMKRLDVPKSMSWDEALRRQIVGFSRELLAADTKKREELAFTVKFVTKGDKDVQN